MVPQAPHSKFMDSERKQSIRYLFNILKLQVLLPAATNPVSQANTTKEHPKRDTIRKAMKFIIGNILKKEIKKGQSRKRHFVWYPAVTIT